jgi:hypothetical protein
MRNAGWALAAVVILAACTDDEQPLGPELSARPLAGTVSVTTSADAGAGSFRAALELANLDPSISRINFAGGVGSIALASPLNYNGAQSLTIAAGGATLDGSALAPGETNFLADGGGNLTLRSLTVENAPGPGLIVDLPDDATGTVHVTLAEVQANNNGSHGIIINDQAEYFNDPNSTSDSGSAAGLTVTVAGSRFEDNGFTDLDQDGLRINEGGAGDLTVTIDGTVVQNNGGDGVELDERSTGNAVYSVATTQLNGNGSFSSADFDDGMDVDESGDGDIIGRFRDVVASANFEQGLDINENDAGNIRAVLIRVTAVANAEEGIEYEEDDDFAGGGDIVAELSDVTADSNGTNGGDAGLKLREKGIGNLSVTLGNARARSNLVGGIQLREDSDGNLFAGLANAVADGNAEDGIDFDENGDGDLDARLAGVSSASSNGEAGVDAEQQTAGVGSLVYRILNAVGNGDGAIDADAGVVVTQVP